VNFGVSKNVVWGCFECLLYSGGTAGVTLPIDSPSAKPLDTVDLDQEFYVQDRFRNMIADEYLVNWIVDNLPATTRYRQTGRIISGGL
jgi:hypothetical protein